MTSDWEALPAVMPADMLGNYSRAMLIRMLQKANAEAKALFPSPAWDAKHVEINHLLDFIVGR